MRHCQPTSCAVARVCEESGPELAGDGGGAVAGQPLEPVLVSGLQRALDQQAAKAAAVDEEIALDLLASLERHRGDATIRRA